MSHEQLRCLIVGETPAAQLIGWRLSLGGSFIILTSNYVSSDGLVAWKSSKLGANFYTPNIFAKNMKELAPKMLDENRDCKYSLDVVLVSAISIDGLEENCNMLATFVNDKTTVLVSADFGCELEKIALRALGDRCRCVLSVACDVECRQLSLGSYALVNDDNCEIYLGNSYSATHCTEDEFLCNNIKKTQRELNDNAVSSVARMVHQLEATQWIKVEQVQDTTQMALKLWQLIIPKISLNILSIIYEQFDYEKMLQNKSTEIIFKGLVHELLDICKAQCNSKVDGFLKHDLKTEEAEIDFTKVIDHCKRKRNELIDTTANEYPEYLFLPFELYCFYHRFEYPAQILLYQPILLAEEYHVPCSNLNFLYGFYSRLLSLSGLSINGGRLEPDMTQLAEHVEDSAKNSVTAKRCKCKTKVKDGTLKSKLGIKATTSKPRYFRGIFSVASPAGANYTLPSISEHHDHQASCPAKSKCCHSSSSSEDDDAESTDSNCEAASRKFETELRCHCDLFDPLRASKGPRVCRSQGSSEHGHASTESCNPVNRVASQSALDEISAITLPHFTKKYSTRSLTSMSSALTKTGRPSLGLDSRPHSASGLEMQLRSDRRLASDYRDLQEQLLASSDAPLDPDARNARRRQFLQLEKQLWRMQRQYNIMNGTITNSRLGPYSDLLSHIELLCGDNNSDIIRFTTSRYGDLDLYTSIERDKDHIITLFTGNSDRKKHSPNEDHPIAVRDSPTDSSVGLHRSS